METGIKVLIVDDSSIYRSQIRNALSGIPWIEVVGAVSNGKIAISKLQISSVDLLILDLEMPEMNGLQTIAELKKQKIECKVIIFSSSTKRSADSTLLALAEGVSDFVMKPGPSQEVNNQSTVGDPAKIIRDSLLPKISALFEKKSIPEDNVVKIQKNINETVYSNYSDQSWNSFNPRVVVIGSSTGGPTVLEYIVKGLAPTIRCPILIAQHMPPVFTTAFAERLQKQSGIITFEGQDGMMIKANSIYVAPGGFHMTIVGSADNPVIRLDQGPLINFVRPAVDPLFQSAAQLFKKNCLGVVLTGMGSDGKEGAQMIKNNGGVIVIQNEMTSIVFGMPGAIMKDGTYDMILSPEEIVQKLKCKIT